MPELCFFWFGKKPNGMARGVGTPLNSNTAGPVIIFLFGIVLILFALIEKCGVSASQVVYLPRKVNNTSSWFFSYGT